MTERGDRGRYKAGDADPVESRRARDRVRKRLRAESMRIGHRVPGHHGHGARSRKEAAIQETVVRRRCEGCDQTFEAKVKDALCLHCGLEVQTK